MYDATPAVELLERAIGYTRGTLANVRADQLDQPTPCSRWRLGTLLDHMADSLDALTEASSGFLPLTPSPWTAADEQDRVGLLKARACALLGAWSAPAARSVLVGGQDLDARLLVGAGALEIVVHGWDVGQATGGDAGIPEDLAQALLPVARSVVGAAERGTTFAPAMPPLDPASWGDRLVAFCGRSPLQHHQSHR